MDFIKELFFSKTGKDTFIVSIGTLVNVILGGLFFIIVPRVLGPSDYGLFSTVIATGAFIAVIANLGLDTGLLRFAPQNPKITNQILSLALKSYIAIGLFFATVGFFVAPLVASLLSHPEITSLLRIAFGGTIFLLLSNFFVAGLQARGEFLKASIVNISSNLVRFLILVFAIFFWQINLIFLTLLFFFVTIVSVLIGKVFLPVNLERTDKNLLRRYWQYNLWVALSLLAASIPFDNFFLLKIAGPISAGVYAAPLKLLTVSYAFGGSFTRVLASRFASFKNREDAVQFTKKSLSFPIFFALGLLISIAFAAPLVNIIFGSSYASSILVYRILAIGFVFFFLATIPGAIILYYLGNSKISFYISAARVAIYIVLLAAFVPPLKEVGAAVAFSLNEFIALVLLSLYALFKIGKKGETRG